jgi:hypothetical protein
LVESTSGLVMLRVLLMVRKILSRMLVEDRSWFLRSDYSLDAVASPVA